MQNCLNHALINDLIIKIGNLYLLAMIQDLFSVRNQQQYRINVSNAQIFNNKTKKMSQQQKLITPETNSVVAKAITTVQWYESLKKPSITPPQWAFPVVWTILYIMMAVSFYIYLKDSKSENTTGILLFAIQLVLNLIWTPLFFWKKMIKVALVDIVLLWAMILATIIVFHERSPLAAYLLIPYLLWVSVATYLNAYIVKNNPEPIQD